MSVNVLQTRDDFLVMKQPWRKCSNRWDERSSGRVRKHLLLVRAKNGIFTLLSSCLLREVLH